MDRPATIATERLVLVALVADELEALISGDVKRAQLGTSNARPARSSGSGSGTT